MTTLYPEGQLVRQYEPCNAGLAGQNLNKPLLTPYRGSQMREGRATRASFAEDSSALPAAAQHADSSGLGQILLCSPAAHGGLPAVVPSAPGGCFCSSQHYHGYPYKPGTVNLPPDSLPCGYSRAECNIMPSL